MRLVSASDIRPTADRVKEAIFSILGSLDEIAVLDAFAGTGALAIEALSRGASSAFLVERSSAALEAIRANLDKTGFADRSRVQQGDIRRVVAGPAPNSFGLVLLDPPYRWSAEEVSSLLEQLAGSDWLALGAQVVLEQSRRVPAPEYPEGWRSSAERAYGDTLVLVIDS